MALAIGLALLAYGLVEGRRDLVEAGQAAAAVLGLFLGFAIFFELVLHISGSRLGPLGEFGLPAALVILGILIVLRGFFRGRR